MKKNYGFVAICLSIMLICFLVGCKHGKNTSENVTNESDATHEIIELTMNNWENYLTFQNNSDTSPVTTRKLYGLTVYEATGTFKVNFYSKANVKYENVEISIELWISTIAYAFGDKASIAISDRRPDDWYFTSNPYPQSNETGFTYWIIKKSGTLSNEGEISFSEPCKMSYIKSSPYGSVSYRTLDKAVSVHLKGISGQVVVDKK